MRYDSENRLQNDAEHRPVCAQTSPGSEERKLLVQNRIQVSASLLTVNRSVEDERVDQDGDIGGEKTGKLSLRKGGHLSLAPNPANREEHGKP